MAGSTQSRCYPYNHRQSARVAFPFPKRQKMSHSPGMAHDTHSPFSFDKLTVSLPWTLHCSPTLCVCVCVSLSLYLCCSFVCHASLPFLTSPFFFPFLPAPSLSCKTLTCSPSLCSDSKSKYTFTSGSSVVPLTLSLSLSLPSCPYYFHVKSNAKSVWNRRKCDLSHFCTSLF